MSYLALAEYFPTMRPMMHAVGAGGASVFINCDERAEKILARYPALKKSIAKKFLCGSSGWFPLAVDDLEKFERDNLKLPLCEFGSLVYLTVESSDKELKRVCEKMADMSRIKLVDDATRYKESINANQWQLENYLKMQSRSICAVARVESPFDDEESEPGEIIAAAARMCDAKWWRRKVRTQQARMLEHAARILGLVNKKTGIYVSTPTYWRHVIRKGRNRELLENLLAENDMGQVYTLAELSDLGVSNPVNRSNELITRVRGFEEWAAKDGGNWSPMFYTLTAPSRFHSHDIHGKKYDLWEQAGSPSPRDAQAWLCNVWELVRAELARSGVRVFGLRVAEPHHDGCPHWHIALWVPAADVSRFDDVFFYYAIGADGDLPPTESMIKRRLKIEAVRGANPKTGEPESMVGYVLKYITKNVNGVKNNGEEFEQGAISKALRVEAWASTWGIRQFQQIGGAPVTVWREFRRIEVTAANSVEEIWRAADEGDWALYTSEMGGAVVARRDLPVRPMYLRKKEGASIRENSFGEAIKVVAGVVAWGWLEIKTRLRSWVVVARAKPAQSWTCVNNCTEGVRREDGRRAIQESDWGGSGSDGEAGGSEKWLAYGSKDYSAW